MTGSGRVWPHAHIGVELARFIAWLGVVSLSLTFKRNQV